MIEVIFDTDFVVEQEDGNQIFKNAEDVMFLNEEQELCFDLIEFGTLPANLIAKYGCEKYSDLNPRQFMEIYTQENQPYLAL